MRVALVNTNRMKPPIAPVAVDYLAEALHSAGHSIEVLDLCWEEDADAAIARFFSKDNFNLVGMTLRNTDDCAYPDCQSFLPAFIDMVQSVRKNTNASIVLGGIGFSVMPEKILSLSKPDFGIWGEGEFVLTGLAERLEKGENWQDLPSLIWLENGQWRRNPPAWKSLAGLPAMRRNWVNNRRYYLEGGQIGFETKRGCSADCIYCADPQAKGRHVRLRPAAAVVDELEELVAQEITVFHTCDGEFNMPESHAMDVCREILRRGLGNRIRWYAYCSPAPFSHELARLMRQAGCAGIDFGADNGNEAMLKRLGRSFGPADVLNAAKWTKEEGMAVMLDLLLGGPGETRESIIQTVEMVKQADPDRAGVSLGVRIWPGTQLDKQAGGGESMDPVFFIEPQIKPFMYDLLNSQIGDDKRFLFFDPAKPKQNYNYNANQRLVDAIAQGYRGAFWDILRLYDEAS